ncbi:hypothetical protein [Ferruginibacter sp. SUN106]|uniref:hypothetical protein n=1 Tax=Ferruginibacter sp. SUN106 TaxID=2978348 RepID=UPI003D35D3C8
MLKRIIEIIAGIALAICLIASYSSSTEPGRLLIWYIIPPRFLQIIVWIALFLLASRLVWGKPKDQSKYFYDLFVKLFGDPKKRK